MARHFDVVVRDAITNKKIITFKARVVRKEQESGRIGGDVKETLYVDGCKIKIHPT